MSETLPEDLPPLPDFCWPADTSCVPDWNAWDVEPDEDEDEPGVPLYSDADKARAISLAGQTLRMLTAFRVGGCPITVRPAARKCREQTWQTYVVTGAGSTPWRPVDLGGTWLNVGCGHGSCGCVGLREVRLYGTASSVSVVKVDGEDWPLCQNLAAPDTEDGTWSVTYSPGAEVDGLGAYAAGVLAGEFVRACGGGECRLPTNVTQIARNGVTMTLGLGAFPDGKTGIREVDLYVERWNPYGHKTAPLVWSPDLARPRRTN